MNNMQITPSTITDLTTANSNTVCSIQFINERPINYLKTDAPEAPMLLKIIDKLNTQSFLRKGIVGMLVGSGGIGKTHFFAQLALSVATGKTFLDKYLVMQAGNVFIGFGENSDEDIHRLFRKMSKDIYSNTEINLASNRIATMSFMGQQTSFIHDGKPTLYFLNLLKSLKEKEPLDGWTLIIFDPISRLLGANAETDNATATQFIALLEQLTLELKGNPTILFGHHMSKAGLGTNSTDQSAARGSSALTDGVRWQANLDRVKNEEGEIDQSKILFKVTKSNFTAIYSSHILIKNEYGRLNNIDTNNSNPTTHKKQKSIKQDSSHTHYQHKNDDDPLINMYCKEY